MVYFEMSLFLIYLILGFCKKSELADKPIGDKLIKDMILSLSSLLHYLISVLALSITGSNSKESFAQSYVRAGNRVFSGE